MVKSVHGIVFGKTIELDEEPGLPDGQSVAVDIRPDGPRETVAVQPALWWIERLVVDPDVKRGKFVIKGTRVLVDSLVDCLAAGETDDKLLHRHPELTPDDIAAAREYSKVPSQLRNSFGSLAEEADDLDRHLEQTRRDRSASPRSADD
jgi:uncharacterized protein (DUF433 family)